MKVKMQNKWPELIFILSVILIFFSCQTNPENMADMILNHAYVYPVTGDPIEEGAIAIVNGKIIEAGRSSDILKKWKINKTEVVDCKGAFLMPGFIEGHGHFSGLGNNLIDLDLLDTHSWQEIVDSVASYVSKAKPGEWIIGRGWHQEKWNTPVDPNINGYPYHDLMSRVSPDNPVMLGHASGHAIMANKAAMEAAHISLETADPAGGRIVRDQEGTALGVFEENAMELIKSAYHDYQLNLTPEEKTKKWYKAVNAVQDHCLSFGITTFEDMGSTFEEIERYNLLAKEDSLDIRLWVLYRESLDEMKNHIKDLPIIRSGQDMFTCRGIKEYIDGALGSFGAWLLAPYSDNPELTGQNTTPVEEIKNIAELCIKNDLQLAVHAIGDRGNRTVLDLYEETMKANPGKKDLRWRIEHAQHIDTADIPRFKELNVIASMQPIHCTSDAPFVVKRLGEKRARLSAYPWSSLLDAGAMIACGTDAPVERVDPIPNIYSAVTRRRLDTGQEFFPEQAMTRSEALYAYTMANAYAAFEDDIKGSLEPGKWADIVLLSQNLLTCPDDSIPKTKVLMTIVGGKIKYRSTEFQH
jgi:predicted amidohydrolase YtcJ